MQRPHRRHIAFLILGSIGLVAAASPRNVFAAQEVESQYAMVFDEHWQRLEDDYPFFDLYGIDWKAEREEHRPKAVAAESDTEFVWEMARMFTAFEDAHVSYNPPVEVLKTWSLPGFRVKLIERKAVISEWDEDSPPIGPERYHDDPHAYPEVVTLAGAPVNSASRFLAGGPAGTTLKLRLRWPDGTETDEKLVRPDAPASPPKRGHYGEGWIHSGRVGSIGYLRVKTFDPDMGTLGPAGKMTPILRKHLKELADTDGLILDVQHNGGGMVAASDPFLSHFLTKRRSYRWGNANGKSRVLNPKRPRYKGDVVVVVDDSTASGGEWAARILRDAGRAQVIGDRTWGAEAAVHVSTASDGSTVQFSAWPMVEPGVTPFQEKGVELDHSIPLTVADVRKHGYDEALERAVRARFAKSLEVLGGPAADLDALLDLVEEANKTDDTAPAK